MADECERKIKDLFIAVNDLIGYIQQGNKNRSVDRKFQLLSELKISYDNYDKFFHENFDNLPEYKQPLYSRQGATVESRCVKAVESLDFVYDTDFLYALDLNETLVNEDANAPVELKEKKN